LTDGLLPFDNLNMTVTKQNWRRLIGLVDPLQDLTPASLPRNG